MQSLYDYRKYSLGGWLKKAAPIGLGIVGAGIGSLVAPGAGTMLGASLGAQLGGQAGGILAADQQQKEAAAAQQSALDQQALQQTNANRIAAIEPNMQYNQSYACGGMMNSYADGGIYIQPSKRGTFRTQATKMGMSVQEAADKILSAKEGTYSPEMRQKANFARNFAKAYGGYMQNGGPFDKMVSSTPVAPDVMADRSARLTDFNNMVRSQNAAGYQYNYPTGQMRAAIMAGKEDEAWRASAANRATSQQAPIEYQKRLKTLGLAPDNAYPLPAELLKWNKPIPQDLKTKYNLRAYGGPLDDITEYATGGTHEENSLGGIPLGNKASVEQGEVRYKDYIFSNRIKRG